MSTSASGPASRIQVIKKPRIKVLITVRELDQGGIERDVAKIATHLDRERFDPHVMAFWAHGFRYDELRAAGVPVIEIPVRSFTSLATLRLAAELRGYIIQHGFQVVHSYDASYVFACTVARFSGVPLTIGSQLSYLDTVDERTQMWLRLGSRVPDAMLANCEAMRRYLIDDEHVRANRVEMIYNGVDTTQFYPPESRPGRPSIIGIVCALRPEKNLPLLQQAFGKVHASHPELRLVIVGSGAELKSLQENAARLEITDAINFIPATRDVPTGFARWTSSCCPRTRRRSRTRCWRRWPAAAPSWAHAWAECQSDRGQRRTRPALPQWRCQRTGESTGKADYK